MSTEHNSSSKVKNPEIYWLDYLKNRGNLYDKHSHDKYIYGRYSYKGSERRLCLLVWTVKFN